MKRFTRILFIPLLFLFSFAHSEESCSFEGWTHMELGAGNYGSVGGSLPKSNSQMNIPNISEQIYSPPCTTCPCSKNSFDPAKQYQVLFWTLDELIRRNGDQGVFHVNDIETNFALYAASKLQEYAASKGYDGIIIEPVVGDYSLMESELLLSKYGREKYDSVHLKNAEPCLYYSKNHNQSQVRAQCENTRNLLQKLANLSHEGLFFFTLYYNSFIPEIERREFMERGIFYQETQEWEQVHYISPRGKTINKDRSRVFFIPAENH